MLASQLKAFVIVPVLDYLELNSKAAINLLLGTAAIESGMGSYLRQIGFNLKSERGAFGLWGIELSTHDAILTYLDRPSYKAKKIKNVIKYVTDGQRTAIKQKIFLDVVTLQYMHIGKHDDRVAAYKANLIGNLYYQCAIARCRYLMIPESLPADDDVEGLANYWKTYYNTEKGKGTVQGFVENYKRYVLCGT